MYDNGGVGGSESSTSAAAEDTTGSGNSKWNIVTKKHKSKVKGLMSSGVTGEGGELVRESARDSETLPLDSSSEPRTSKAEKPCSGSGVHSDAVTAQIQGTEAESLPRAAVSRKLESKARVSTGATPGDEAAIKVVDSMPDKVAAAGKEDAEEGSNVLFEEYELINLGLKDLFLQPHVDLITLNPTLMELPFSNLEIIFILIAFTVFSMITLASIYSEPEDEAKEKEDLYEQYKRLKHNSKKRSEKVFVSILDNVV
ncbi:UNVERIFIED_CONTAM: hypothetical protein FKN15_051574 [Acipenser sinensis]